MDVLSDLLYVACEEVRYVASLPMIFTMMWSLSTRHLEYVYNGELDDGTYIPMRARTPQIYIDVVKAYTKGETQVMQLPMIASVKHIYQNMEEDDGTSYGKKRPHNLDADDLVKIAYKMSDPQYIVKQRNGRFAEVVSFMSKRNRKVIVSISIATKTDNYKYSEVLNGYQSGYYNVIVTEYEPDDLEDYLSKNEIIYDKKNGTNPVGLGSIISVTQDLPFFDPNGSADLDNSQGYG